MAVDTQFNGTAGQIESNSNKVTTITADSTDIQYPTAKAAFNALATKVTIETGKGLSENNYTNEEKTKLAGIEAGANKTIIDTAMSETSVNPVQNKTVKSYVDGNKTTTIVNTPAFTNQPTITGALNSAFVNWKSSYYFVHIINATAGTFQLMTDFNTPSSVIAQTFTLSGLNTGNSGVLTENTFVDFLEIGTNWKMRMAGVSRLDIGSCLGYKEIEINANGLVKFGGACFSPLSVFNTLNTSNYKFLANDINGIYTGGTSYASGFWNGSGTVSGKLFSYNLNAKLTKNTKTLDLTGIFSAGLLTAKNPIARTVKQNIFPINTYAFEQDGANMPDFNSFALYLDAGSAGVGFLNGFELVVIRKGA